MLLTILTALLLCQDPQAEAPGGQRRALLVGINDYRSDAIPDLRGCVNDVATLAHVLRSRYGFDDVRTLCDAQATRAAILQELERVVAATQRSDFLFVHYSGHGSQQQDHDGDEGQDGLDETLVAHDSRSGDVPDIVDDEIDAILSRLRTSNAVVSFDACHSGTGTRDLRELRTRDVPPDPRVEVYRDVATVRTRGGAVRYLAISSALARERALDGPVDGTPHGLFSLALARVLGEQPLPGEGRRRLASIAECERLVLEGYRDIVDALGCAHRASTPTFELVGYDGDAAAQRRRLEAELLPAPRPGRGARVPWLVVSQDGANVRLNGDAALGAGVGTSWAIFPAGETAFLRGAIAWGEIVAVDTRGALLELRGGRGVAGSLVDCRAVRMAPAAAAGALRVRLELPEAERARARELLTKLSARPVVVTDSPDVAVNFVMRSHGAGEGVRVLAGDEVSAIRERASIDEAARVVARSVTAANLLALDNPMSALRVKLSTDLVGGETLDRDIGVMRARRKPSADGYRVYREEHGVDASNCLQVHVEAEQDCYVTLVNVDGQGRVGLLFPNAVSEENGWLPDGLVPGGLRVSIPDAVRDDCAAGFLLPFLSQGAETIRVFATADLQTAERIREAVREAQRLQREDAAATEVEQVLVSLREDLVRATFATREVGVMGVGVVANKPRREPSEAAARPEGGAASEELQPLGDWAAASIGLWVTGEER